MPDTITKEERSRVMRQVRSKGNKSTELKLVELFRENKITGWRRHLPLIGKPDFAFAKAKTVVFVDGCFWHGHDCRNTTPAANADYWRKKIERNRKRDAIVSETLVEKGWQVFRVWECELKKSPEKVLRRIVNLIYGK